LRIDGALRDPDKMSCGAKAFCFFQESAGAADEIDGQQLLIYGARDIQR
jgi:hypothetical protein